MSTIANHNPELSVIIPFWNEAGSDRLEHFKRTIEALHIIMSTEFPGRYELIGVNDGSTDDSVKVAQAADMTIIDADPKTRAHHGKGTAVLAGLAEAKGNVRLFTDADGSYVLGGDSYQPDTILNLYKAVKAGADVAVARRADSAKAHDGKSRSIYHSMSQRLEAIAPTGVSDPQAGAKAFSASAAELLDKYMPYKKQRYGTDRMMLHLARILDLKVAEVDAEIEVVAGSHVRPFQVGPQLVWQAFKARRLGEKVLDQQLFRQFEPEPVVLNY
jgi:glycosyltransferase involved in cell wall biosynthesis